MDEKRTKLIEMMKALNLPLTDKKAEETVSDLSEDEVDHLVTFYSEVIDYENQVEDFVRQYAPDKYEKLVSERDEKIKKKESDFEYELEKLQEEKDILLDSEEIKKEREIEEVAGKIESDAEELEGLQNDITNALSSNNSVSK